MNKAIFLDRDGTIIVDNHYAFLPESIKFVDGVIPALRKFQKAGYLLIIITNQSGIARGIFTEQQLNIFNSELLKKLETENIYISAIYYCPHHPDGIVKKYAKKCKCRKPGLDLFFKAVIDFNIDLSQSYAIGDKLSDCAICTQSSCKGCLIGTTEAENVSIYAFKNMTECANYIVR